MPPTIQANGRHEGRSRSTSEKRSDLVCKVKYNNTLPDIPFDPKFIVYPFESNRYVQYNPTSLERGYKFDLLTEHDLGVSIDLINPDTYRVDPHAYLDIEDELLLEDESNTAMDAKRSRHHNKNVSWLRKTEYISTEYNRFTQSAQKAEARVGYNIKKQMKDEVLYKDRESQIKAIMDTFDSAKTPINQHYSKPGVTAIEVLPMYPDFEMWKQPCAQVIFDTDPAQKGKTLAGQNEEMSQAMIRGMVDEHGEQFVAYFLPTAETIDKHKRDLELGVEYEDEEEYDYVLAGEYNWNVKNKASRGYEENYFFVQKDDGIYYNELETRVRLSKRRKIGASATTAKSRLIVRHRPLTDQELAGQDARVMMLEPPGEEEEELELRRLQRLDEAEEGDERNAESPTGSDVEDDEGTSRRKRRASERSATPTGQSDAEDQRGSPRDEEGEGNSRQSSPASRNRSAPVSPTSQHDASPEHSPVVSRDGSPAASRDGSRASSRAASPAGSQQNGSPARSRSASPDDESPVRSRSGSPDSPGGSPDEELPPGSSNNRSAPESPMEQSPTRRHNDRRSESDDNQESAAERLRNEEAEIFGSDSDDN